MEILLNQETIFQGNSPIPAAHLKFKHQVQPMLPQGVDGIDNQCYDDVNAIRLMLGYTGLEKEGWGFV